MKVEKIITKSDIPNTTKSLENKSNSSNLKGVPLCRQLCTKVLIIVMKTATQKRMTNPLNSERVVVNAFVSSREILGLNSDRFAFFIFFVSKKQV